ncbi:hypothetical protein INR49_005053 [Caranx melampygus]|nr:hypothetical protein INR49_005053 [Caranx melampygus]
MSLVLSDSVTAALQSSMRRWMTVLTTCIWIGIKVRYAPMKVLGLFALRVIINILPVLPPLHMVSANHCPAVSLLFSVASHPLTLSPFFSLTLPLYNLSDIKLQGCCFAELQNSHCRCRTSMPLRSQISDRQFKVLLSHQNYKDYFKPSSAHSLGLELSGD